MEKKYSANELTKILQNVWDKLNGKERQFYKNIAEHDKERYRREKNMRLMLYGINISTYNEDCFQDILKPYDAFYYFSNDLSVNRKYTREAMGVSMDLDKYLEEVWDYHPIDDEERQQWIDMAEQDQQRYNNELKKVWSTIKYL